MSTYEQDERAIDAVKKATESEAQQFKYDRATNARAKGIELAVQRAEAESGHRPAEWVDLFTFADRVTTYILTGYHDPDDHSAPHHRGGV